MILKCKPRLVYKDFKIHIYSNLILRSMVLPALVQLSYFTHIACPDPIRIGPAYTCHLHSAPIQYSTVLILLLLHTLVLVQQRTYKSEIKSLINKMVISKDEITFQENKISIISTLSPLDSSTPLSILTIVTQF